MSIVVPDECTLAEALARCSPFHPCRPGDLRAGKSVLAVHHGRGGGGGRRAFFPARIVLPPTGYDAAAGSAAGAAGTATYSCQFVGRFAGKGDLQHGTPLDDIQLHERVHKDNFDELLLRRTTIHLREGVHDLGGRVARIDFPVTLAGLGRENKTILRGGLWVGKSAPDHSRRAPEEGVVLRRVTIRGSPSAGVECFNGLPLLMQECSVEECATGVCLFTARGRLENVRVKRCRGSGVVARAGGVVELKHVRPTNRFSAMKVEGNCLAGGAGDYGLDSGYSHGKIMIDAELSQGAISRDNRGGGNWGGQGIRQLKKVW
jgi:hypothetical protein